ncbi:MAG: Fumarate hydratase class II [Syntrophus sp. SKADARSKE-3]|nr:Fumarate hydratase class II [Syntrophus sp. SKADARSKE-3]
MSTREEKDSLGIVSVPAESYWGAQTQRAVENFPVSGVTFPAVFIRTLALVKKGAAVANQDLGLLDKKLSEAIIQAAQEVVDGKLDGHFPLDVFQTGSGTSTNMNANEVIAGRANEIITGTRGGKSPVHPNDHVNMGQSSNDVIPSVIHIASLIEINNRLLPALARLQQSLARKSGEFGNIMKIGRTHLQDAIPIRLGQEFGGYARQIELAVMRIKAAGTSLSELSLGGTAVGNGLNTHPEFARRVITLISEETGFPFSEARNHFAAQAMPDAALETSGALKELAVTLSKIAGDIRLMASGPRCGLGEINLPSLQPGSSIMPGKINPVIIEVVVQVAAQVIGNDTAIAIGCQGGFFELNTMLPLIAYNLLNSFNLLISTATLFDEKCVRGITANAERCTAEIEQSLALATYLTPRLGYDRAAKIANEAFLTGKTVRQVARESGLLTDDEVEAALSKIYSDI